MKNMEYFTLFPKSKTGKKQKIEKKERKFLEKQIFFNKNKMLFITFFVFDKNYVIK